MRDETEHVLAPFLEKVFDDISVSQELLGVSVDQVPLDTREAINYLVPPSLPTRRATKKSLHRQKTYVKANGSAILQSCLGLAIHPNRLALYIEAIQPEFPFFDTDEGKECSGLAFLAIKGLSDLAKKVGLSYGQTQQIVLLMIVLGFMKRFRSGRRYVYAIPLGPYIPCPSPKAVQQKIANLLIEIDSQKRSSSKSANEKRESFRKKVELVKLRYEDRYGLAPNFIEAEDFQKDTLDKMLREIRATLPEHLRASHMPRIEKIISTYLDANDNALVFHEANAKKLETAAHVLGQHCLGEENTRGDISSHGHSTRTESATGISIEQNKSPFDHSSDHPSSISLTGQHEQKSFESLLDEAFGDSTSESERDSTSFSRADEIDLLLDTSGSAGIEIDSNLFLMPSTESPSAPPTFYRNCVSSHLNNKDRNTNDNVHILSEEELSEYSEILALALEHECANGKIVFTPSSDPNVQLSKAGTHKKTLRDTDLVIAKAAFVYTLLTARWARIIKTPAAHFTYTCKAWSNYKTYENACKANTESRETSHVKEGKGVPKKVRRIMNLFGHRSLEELEILINRCTDEELKRLYDDGVPPVFAWSSSSLTTGDGVTLSDRDQWLISLGLGETTQKIEEGMPLEEAQELLKQVLADSSTVQPVGTKEKSNNCYTALVSLRGNSWELHSREEWERYVTGIQHIEQLKQRLKTKM